MSCHCYLTVGFYVLDSLLWGSTVGCPSYSLASCISYNLLSDLESLWRLVEYISINCLISEWNLLCNSELPLCCSLLTNNSINCHSHYSEETTQQHNMFFIFLYNAFLNIIIYGYSGMLWFISVSIWKRWRQQLTENGMLYCLPTNTTVFLWLLIGCAWPRHWGRQLLIRWLHWSS